MITIIIVVVVLPLILLVLVIDPLRLYPPGLRTAAAAATSKISSPTALATPAPNLANLLANGDDLALDTGALPTTAELLQGLGLEATPGAASLRVRQVRPRVDGAEEQDGAEQDEYQPLARGARVARVDAVDDEHGHQAPDLPGGRRDAVARAPVAGREDLGGQQEGQRVRAEVEGEVANGDEGDRGRRGARVRDAVVHGARSYEQEGQYEEGGGQPPAPRQPVREPDEGGAAGDGARRYRQEVLLGLLDEHLGDGLARVRGVGGPGWEGAGVAPAGHRRGAAAVGERRVPAWQVRVDGYGGVGRPYVG